MNLTTDSLQGHAGWRWSLPQGDSVFVAQQGAQVLSWQAGHRERLYLSPTSVCDGTTAIRGGIPVCFPQFNQRGILPKHGFARNMAWRLVAEQSQGSEKVFELSDNAQTRALWPIQFKTQLKVLLSDQGLKIQLSVQNLGIQTLSFTGALHTYFAVNQSQQVSLQGQAHQAEWVVLVLCPFNIMRDAVRRADFAQHVQCSLVRAAMGWAPEAGHTGCNRCKRVGARAAAQAYGRG